MKKKIFVITLIIALVISMIPASAATVEGKTSQAKAKNYIYFDLYLDDVTITDSTYHGYVYKNGVKTEIKGTHNKDNEYYIYQSKGYTDTSWDAQTGLPVYERVMDGQWGKYITNNTSVETVIDEWIEAATAVGREETPTTIKTNINTVIVNDKKNPDVDVPMHHRINIESSANVTTNFNVTIDNVWSGFQNDDCKDKNGDLYKDAYISDGPHYRKSGGFTFRPQNKTTTANVYLKGDNRFGNIHYETGGGAGAVAGALPDAIDNRVEQMYFHNGETAGETEGTLTVANLSNDEHAGYNHFCAVIGGANNPDYVPGLVFESGIIFAGSTVIDNCTSIGGGGCGFGGVTINGGTITAVAATNGAAIGGGIGDGSNGGAADISITGGTVYAYNHGLAIEGTRESGTKIQNEQDAKIAYAVMPAVAIGSGSSRREYTVPAKINITGGTVYAQSVGGTAIGGGSSVNLSGANAEINISGGTVTAKSIAGIVPVIHEHDSGIYPTFVMENGVQKTQEVSASTSIGGGTAGVPFRLDRSVLNEKGELLSGKEYVLRAQGSGGNATLNITQDEGKTTRVYAGSIGGGGVNKLTPDPYGVPRPAEEGKIGAAHVTIEEGVVQGQVIMAAGANEDCSFNMTGGTIDNSTKDETFTFLKENGGAVYVENGNATMSGGLITNCDDTKNGGAFYVIGGECKIDGGTITNCSVTENGGAIYVNQGTFEMTKGSITKCKALNGNGGAVYVNETPVVFGANDGEVNISGNEAKNGGAFYLLQSSDDTTTISNGIINDNKVSENGGAIYCSNGTVTVAKGSITNNEASNGGGIFVTNGGLVEMTGAEGFITYNKAVVSDDEFDELCESVKTGYKNTADNLKGTGGGIYLEKQGKFVMAAQEVGIYGNTAKFAADDVFANGDNTKLTVPDVTGMKLAGFDEKVKPNGWFEDYVNNDSDYAQGLAGDSVIGGKRYKTAGVNIVRVEDIKKANEVGEYVCMTIGLGRGDLQIKKIVTDKLGRVIDTDETYVFRITGEPFDGSGYIDMYVTIHGTGIETIYNLPYADYKVLEVGNTEWRYDVTVDGKASINNETKTPIITVTNKLVDSRWLTAESSINNIFTKS